MIPLPYFEDIHNIYIKYIFDTLFPPNLKQNKFLVYFIALFHLIGTVMISMGIFFPPFYQPLFLVYLLLIASSYPLFKGHCFMTLLANKYSGIRETPLHIRMKTARTWLSISIFFAFIGTFFPDYSLYRLIQNSFGTN